MIEENNLEEALSVFDEPSFKERIKINSKKESIYDSYPVLKVNVGDKLACSLVENSTNKGRELLFDGGIKTNIIVNSNSEELSTLSKYEDKNNITVYVTSIQENPYCIYGSLKQSRYNSLNNLIKTVVDTEYPIDAYVKEMTPSGYNLTFEFEGVMYNAFMPHTLAGANKIPDDERGNLVGKTLNVHIESYSSDNGTFVASRKSYLESMIPELLSKLDIMKTIYSGKVTGTTDFGVFVEFNECLTGMIHKSSIREDMRDMLSTIKAGTEIDFYVKEIIKGRPVLTQYQNDYSLWDTMKIGDVYEASVKSIINYGVLVSIDNDINGLISKKDIKMDVDKYKPNMSLKVKVMMIDKSSRKIYLTDRF